MFAINFFFNELGRINGRGFNVAAGLLPRGWAFRFVFLEIEYIDGSIVMVRFLSIP